MKIGVLKNFAKFPGKYLCQNFLFKLQATGQKKKEKETLAQVFSCEFCEISKKTFFTEHLRTTAFEVRWSLSEFILKPLIYFNGALSGLRQFLATESPLKIMKNAFYFTSKTFFVLEIFNFFSWLFWSCGKTACLEGQG